MRNTLFCLCLLASFTTVAFGQQQTRTRSVVTPEGVFTVQTSAGNVVSPEPGSGTFFNPNPTPPGLRWTYPNPGATPWITSSAGIGNFGTMDWLGQTLNGERLSFLSPTETDPPTPIYEDVAPTSDSVAIQVAAADKASACAVAWRNSSTGVDELRYYDGFSTTPAVLSGIPIQEVRISDDGTRIAVGYTNGGNAEVTVYDETLTSLVTVVGAGSGFRHHDISGDGSTVLIASNTTNFVYDVATGNLLHQDGSTVSVDAHSIDGDGDCWGRGGFDVGVWKDIAGTYTRILNFDDGAFGFGVYDACDVSADGSTFVVAGRDATNNLHFRVYCWSLSSTGVATLLWTFNNLGTGSFQDVGTEVSVSDDGKWIAVGSWGAQSNGHPEVLVFDRDVGAVPVTQIDTPGSCYSVDMSGDGQFVVAGTKAVHANTFGNGGEGYSLDLGGQGHWLSGTPSLNRSITLSQNGAPGDQLFLGASLGLLPAGVSFSGWTGLWWLDPGMMILPITPLGPIPASGTVPIPVTVPNSPPLVGVQVFTQAARMGPNEIDNFLRIPITP